MTLIKCDIKPINASYEDYIYKIQYIPFSISTIKLFINNKENYDVDILIKPIRSLNNDDFCGGLDDDNKGLKIIWDKGQEDGISTKIKGQGKKYVFLFVFPSNTLKLLDYNLTLKINKTILDIDKKYASGEIRIKLYPIQNIEFVDNIIHQKITVDSLSNTITFDGELVGNYYPRWYPELFENISSDTNNFYQSEPSIRKISFKIFKKYGNSHKDRIVLNYNNIEIAVIEGDIDGATYQMEAFRFNSSLVIRLWLLWISKNEFLNRINLGPLQKGEEKKGLEFFNNPELPDIERFDIVISFDGKILAVCTDFHSQEYWYKIRRDDSYMMGIIAKLFHPIDESLSRFVNRQFLSNKYENIIKDLRNITSLSENSNSTPELKYIEGKEIEESIQNKKNIPIKRGKNFFRSHVPYVRNGYILSNMISPIVNNYQ